MDRKVDWKTLAHCDGQAVKLAVEYGGLKAERVLILQSRRIFDKTCQENEVWRNCYELCCKAYRDLEGSFKIVHDRYGGYKLIYCGKDKVTAGTLFKKTPIGFITPVPEDFSCSLSVMEKSSNGKLNLMLGPLRFINSDCEPNSKYDFSSDQQLVRIETLKKILPGDEILVKYSCHFFEDNKCGCLTCVRNAAHVHLDAEKEISSEITVEYISSDTTDIIMEQLDVCLTNLIREVAESIISENGVARNCTPEPAPVRKKPRSLKMSEKWSFFEPDQSGKILTPVSACTDLTPVSLCSESIDLETSLYELNQFCNKDSLSTNMCLREKTTSSPILDQSENVLPDISISSINEEIDTSFKFDFEDEEKIPMSIELSPYLKSGLHNTVLAMKSFCLKNNLSDKGAVDLHLLIDTLIDKNNLPSSYAFLKDMKRSFVIDTRLDTEVPGGHLCVLCFGSDLVQIVVRNWNSLISYSDQRKSFSKMNDFYLEVAPPIEPSDEKITLHLVLSTDGVSLSNSSSKGQLWPVWLAIAQLPPTLRFSRKNIALAALYSGSEKPPWQLIVNHMKAELEQLFVVNKVKVQFKCLIIVADIPAKASVLNMYKNNGFNGCNLCTALGTTIGRAHSYYPFEQTFQYRTKDVNEKFVRLADVLNEEKIVFNVVGVKRRSCFDFIVPNLPLSAGVDYMHCVLLGVYKSLLNLQLTQLSALQKKKFNEEIKKLNAPNELIVHARKIRGLNDLGHFKANEFFNYFLFIGVALMKELLHQPFYDYYLCLVFGIRLLLESCKSEDIDAAEKYLNSFCRNTARFFGDSKAETMNVHLLRHMAYQCRNYGPLYLFSAMSFESQNRQLANLFTGTHSHCRIICRRYIQQRLLLSYNVEDDHLTSLLSDWLSVETRPSISQITGNIVHTDLLGYGKLLYPDAIFMSRSIVDGVLFDSTSYSRNKRGPNSFICYTDGHQKKYGQIQYFVIMGEKSLASGIKYACITKIEIISPVGPVPRYYFTAEKTESTDLIKAADWEKMLCIETENNTYLFELCKFFDHK